MAKRLEHKTSQMWLEERLYEGRWDTASLGWLVAVLTPKTQSGTHFD